MSLILSRTSEILVVLQLATSSLHTGSSRRPGIVVRAIYELDLIVRSLHSFNVEKGAELLPPKLSEAKNTDVQ